MKNKLEKASGRYIFAKDSSFPFVGDRLKSLPRGFQHTFLIRHPLRVLSSKHTAILKHLSDNRHLSVDPDNFDFGKDDPFISSGLVYEQVYATWKFVRENIDPHPVVLDGDDLMSRPHEMLPKYCRAVGIPYDESLLRWDSSPQVANSWVYACPDGLDTCYQSFHKRALQSESFYPPKEIPDPASLTHDVLRCAKRMMGYYEEMCQTKLV